MQRRLQGSAGEHNRLPNDCRKHREQRKQEHRKQGKSN